MIFFVRSTIAILLFALLTNSQGAAQSVNKITGPLGVYHTSTGFCYGDSLGTDSILIQQEFRFGDLLFANQSVDNGVNFLSNIDSCVQWHSNRVLGIIQPTTEEGVLNQPADTALYYPYPQSNHPGMVQGGHRFSQLSQIYGPFCGVMIDDLPDDTATLRQMHDAVQGKLVDANGVVHSSTTATTPWNKLYGVIYHTNPDPTLLPYIDGFSYWYSGTNQNCCYMNMDNDIDQLKINCPHKEIMMGIYLQYTNWDTAVSVQYLLRHSLDRYDDGDINSIIFFAGPFLSRDYMPLNEWNDFALPTLLDSIYYPYLGTGQGQLYDCATAQPITNAFVRIYCAGKNSGDTLLRSRQKTDAGGNFQFGVWAGNRNTDSTYYWLITDKIGYHSDTIGFWIKRNETTVIPPISLCATGINTIANENDFALFPNPSDGKFTIEDEQATGGKSQLEIYNVLGEMVYTSSQPLNHAFINISFLPNGIYTARVSMDKAGNYKQHIIILQR